QLLGRRWIEGIVLDAVVVRPHRGRDRVLGRDAGRQIDRVDDRLLVDRHADGLAHAYIVERLLLRLERQIADVETRLFQHRYAWLLPDRVEVSRIRIGHHVAFTLLEL